MSQDEMTDSLSEAKRKEIFQAAGRGPGPGNVGLPILSSDHRAASASAALASQHRTRRPRQSVAAVVRRRPR